VKKQYSGNVVNPLPVALIGTLIDGRPNYCVIGYISPFNFGKHVFFSLYKKRYTWIGIEKNKKFSVNIPSEKLMKEVEICGSKSGRDVDKSQFFGNFYGKIDYDPNKGIIGEVIESYIDSKITSEGVIDVRRAHLITWTAGGDFAYYRLGERIVLPRD
jgi:flavin reductase (DIM6/NTAB) family NADH-FMN oxidoreductase RutF